MFGEGDEGVVVGEEGCEFVEGLYDVEGDDICDEVC